MSTVEIRNYTGDGADLAEFINRSWKAHYSGKRWFPLWDQSYFSWRLLDNCAADGDFLIAAYAGSRIVGCILSEPLDFQIRDRVVKGTLTSWLSVDPEIRIPNLAIRLLESLRKRHQEHGMSIAMGCTNSDPTVASRRFWDYVAERNPRDVRFFGPIRFWSRVFDSRAVSAAGLDAFERISPHFAKFNPGTWIDWRDTRGIRPYHSADLARSHDWVCQQSEAADLRILWSLPRLDWQLGHPYASTLILDEGDRGGGLINYYPLVWSGARLIRIGMIDLFAGNLGLTRQLRLLKAAERKMIADGLQLSLMMVSSAAPARPLLLAGFVPVRGNVDLFWIFPDAGLQLDPPLRHHILFT